jgi:hypothetical protein
MRKIHRRHIQKVHDRAGEGEQALCPPKQRRFVDSRDVVVAREGLEKAVVPVVLHLPGGIRGAFLRVVEVILRILRIGWSGGVAETLLVSCLGQDVEHLDDVVEHLNKRYAASPASQMLVQTQAAAT